MSSCGWLCDESAVHPLHLKICAKGLVGGMPLQCAAICWPWKLCWPSLMKIARSGRDWLQKWGLQSEAKCCFRTVLSTQAACTGLGVIGIFGTCRASTESHILRCGGQIHECSISFPYTGPDTNITAKVTSFLKKAVGQQRGKVEPKTLGLNETGA